MKTSWAAKHVRSLEKAIERAKRARDDAQMNVRNCTNDMAYLEREHQAALRDLRRGEADASAR